LGRASGGEGLVFDDAAPDEDFHFRIFSFDRGLAAVEHGDFPEAARAGALTSDDQLAGTAVLIARIGNDGRHDSTDEAESHNNNDFLAPGAGLLGKLLDAG
jgi:hypothetical protein